MAYRDIAEQSPDYIVEVAEPVTLAEKVVQARVDISDIVSKFYPSVAVVTDWSWRGAVTLHIAARMYLHLRLNLLTSVHGLLALEGEVGEYARTAEAEWGEFNLYPDDTEFQGVISGDVLSRWTEEDLAAYMVQYRMPVPPRVETNPGGFDGEDEIMLERLRSLGYW